LPHTKTTLLPYTTLFRSLMNEAGVRFERLSVPDCAKRWPQIKFDDISWSIYEPDSGYLAARRACEAVLNAFVKEGGIGFVNAPRSEEHTSELQSHLNLVC